MGGGSIISQQDLLQVTQWVNGALSPRDMFSEAGAIAHFTSSPPFRSSKQRLIHDLELFQSLGDKYRPLRTDTPSPSGPIIPACKTPKLPTGCSMGCISLQNQVHCQKWENDQDWCTNIDWSKIIGVVWADHPCDLGQFCSGPSSLGLYSRSGPDNC